MNGMSATDSEIARKCEPCADDGEDNIADGFCQDCNEFLCLSCFTFHTKARAYKKHVLLDKSKMPTTKPSMELHSGDEEECHLHKGEIIHYYCKQHALVGCHPCMMINHTDCQTVKISDLTKDLAEQDEFKKVLETLTHLKSKHDENLQLSKENVSEIEEYHKNAIVSINYLWDVLRKEKEMTKKNAIKKKDKDLDKMENVGQRCEMMLKQMGKLLFELETKKGERLFISLIRAKCHIKPFEASLQKLTLDNEVTRYVFKARDSSLGDFSSLPCQVAEIQTCNIGALNGADITCLAASDEGMLVVGYEALRVKKYPHKHLALKHLALFDTQNHQLQFKTKIQLPSCPYAMAVIDAVQIAATFPQESKIRIFAYNTETLVETRDITVNDRCRGIAHHSGNLIVSYVNPLEAPLQIETIEMNKDKILNRHTLCNYNDNTIKRSGHVMYYISGTCQFPHYVAVNPDGTEMYVTGKCSILSMTLQGNLIDSFSIGHPTVGVIFDHTGTPLACGTQTRGAGLKLPVVYRLSKTAEPLFQDDPSTKSDTTSSDRSPRAMAYNKKDNLLFLALANNVIRIYKLK